MHVRSREDTGVNVGSSNESTLVKVDSDELSLRREKDAGLLIFGTTSTYKTGGVVILHSLGISEGLQNGVSLEQLCLQLPLGCGEASLGGEGDTGTTNQLLATAGMVGGTSNMG